MKYIDHLYREFIFSSATLSLPALQDMVRKTIRDFTNLSSKEQGDITVVLEESVLNAHEHGNLELESVWKDEIAEGGSSNLFEKVKAERLRIPEFAQRKVKIELTINGDEISIVVEDEGNGFQQGEMASEVTSAPFGMGLMIINSLADRVGFNAKGNRITFIKRLAQQG